MKRTILLNILVLGALMLALTACGGQKAAAGATNTAGRLNADYENALPVESQLILGTLQLEDTANAVTAEQAAQLLPMWQMMKELESKDTATTQEKGGLILQIQETMTEAQIQAIAAMKLTQSDLSAYMQKAGLFQRPPQSGTPGAPSSGGGDFPGGMDGEPPAGFVVGGNGPSGGGGMPGGGPSGGANLTSEQLATMEARRASGGAGANPSVLLDALIQLLESKQALT